MNEAGLRHEIKYEISLAAARAIQERLKTVMQPDPHHGPEGYRIHSLYFDDADHSAYRDKVDGIRDRSKLRLRYYEENEDYIVFENKEKIGDLTRKTGMQVSKETALALMRGEVLPLGTAPLLDLYRALKKSSMLHPAVLVDYHRTPFTLKTQNVRITIDSDLRTKPFQKDLFDRQSPMIPVLDPGTCILEVKYDEFLPPYLALILQDVPKTRIAISKFVRCLSILE
ncbi:MAG: polyphosphate polymerase domain-containing protein [Lachnospiraceae bacterium]|nr:polyphosphate polymerase domain-containing protein [Lachnospiraceae bacterium]